MAPCTPHVSTVLLYLRGEGRLVLGARSVARVAFVHVFSCRVSSIPQFAGQERLVFRVGVEPFALLLNRVALFLLSAKPRG